MLLLSTLHLILLPPSQALPAPRLPPPPGPRPAFALDAHSSTNKPVSMSAKQFWKEPFLAVSSFPVMIALFVSLSSRCDCPHQRKTLLFVKLFAAVMSVKEHVCQVSLGKVASSSTAGSCIKPRTGFLVLAVTAHISVNKRLFVTAGISVN